MFNGPTSGGNPTVVLYARVTLVANGTANCAAPAANSAGNTTVLLTGTIATAGVAGFGKKLTVPGIDALPLPLDDFTALAQARHLLQGEVQRLALEGPRNVRVQRHRPGGRRLEPDPGVQLAQLDL